MLDEQIPERNPLLTMTEKEVWFEAGRRSVVRNLKIKLKQQEEDELEKELKT